MIALLGIQSSESGRVSKNLYIHVSTLGYLEDDQRSSHTFLFEHLKRSRNSTKKINWNLMIKRKLFNSSNMLGWTPFAKRKTFRKCTGGRGRHQRRGAQQDWRFCCDKNIAFGGSIAFYWLTGWHCSGWLLVRRVWEVSVTIENGWRRYFCS